MHDRQHNSTERVEAIGGAGRWRSLRRHMRDRDDVSLAVLERGATSRPQPQFRCTACGYGASCRIAPERCPMCGGRAWEHMPPLLAETTAADRDAPLSRERQL